MKIKEKKQATKNKMEDLSPNISIYIKYKQIDYINIKADQQSEVKKKNQLYNAHKTLTSNIM